MGRWLAAVGGLLVVTAIGAFLMSPTFITRNLWILPLLAAIGVVLGSLIGYGMRRGLS